MHKTVITMPKESRGPNRNWGLDFLFLKENDGARCVVCHRFMKRAKTFNITRHYNRFHADEYKECTMEEKRELLETHRKQNIKRERSNSDRASTSSANDNEKINVDSQKGLVASYAVAWEIGRSRSYFTNAKFIKTCAIAMAKAFDNKIAIQQFKYVPLSRQTISRRFTNINNHLLNKLRILIENCAYFSLCLDQSTDINDTIQLAIFIRIVQSDFSVNEELLSLVPLQDGTTDTDIFLILRSEVGQFTDFSKCTCIVTSRDKGLVDLLKLNSIHCPVLHCIVHEQVLYPKSSKLSSVMKLVTKVTDLIRGSNHSLNYRKLKSFLQNKNVAYNDLLSPTEVCGLGTGKLLERFFAIRKELIEFLESELKSKITGIRKELQSNEFHCGLAFLTDITFHFNELNLKLQGKRQNVAHLSGFVNGFRKKLELFAQQLQQENLFYFPCCKEIKDEIPDIEFSSFQENILEILQEFDNRFKDFDKIKKDVMLYIDTMHVPIEDQEVELQLELCDLHTDLSFLLRKETGEDLFKLLPPEKYPKLRNFGLRMTSMFASTYICENSFSSMKMIKTNQRTKLNNFSLTSALRIATTELDISIPELVKKD